MEVHIRNILRIGIYQILFLQTPEFAAVHETVELAKKYGAKSQAFVNAVLRRIAREKQVIQYPSSWSGHLATFWSHPEWLVRYWCETLGRVDTEELLKANNLPPPRIVRVNPLRMGIEEFLAQMAARGIHATKARYAPQAVCLERSPAGGPGGEVWTHQSEASQLISHILDPRPGERILDACAGAGGKTIHIAELMRNQGEIIALGIHGQGVEALQKRVRDAKAGIVKPILGDASRDLSAIADPPFDRILVDAPCTGLGTLRSHPDAKWRRTKADIVSMAKLQRTLLENVVRHLRKGGILVYSTCTLTREENEETVTHLLRAAPALTREGCQRFLPVGCAELVDRIGFFKTFPHRHGLDGFFAARFRKDPS
jgi:16S rRNA (cytosine967-C5)-methyltransferase